MAKYDPESNATTKLAASARLFTDLSAAGPAAELTLSHTNPKCLERIHQATRVALFRLDLQLQEFLNDPEVKSDNEAIAKAAREMNDKRAAEAIARLPPKQRAEVEKAMKNQAGA